MTTFTDAFGGTAGFLDSRAGWTLASGTASKAQTNASGRVDLLNTGATGTWTVYTATAPGGGDHYAQGNVGNSANPLPLIVGWDGVNKQGYGIRFSANFVNLYRLNNGTRTSIASVNTTTNVSLSDLIRLERDNATGALRIYRGGVQVGTTVTDTTYSGTGVGTLAAGAANVTDMLDNWESGRLSATATGAGSATLDDATGAGTGTVRVKGAGAATLDDASGAGTGTVRVKGAGSATLDDAAGAGAGAVRARGAGAATLDDAGGSGTGAVRVKGAGTATLDDATEAGTGALRVKGAGAATLDDVAGSGDGMVIGGTLPVDVPRTHRFTARQIHHRFAPATHCRRFTPPPFNRRFGKAA